ncbi:cell division protein FtsQ/DivIB [Dysgonomonas sp. 511]|uniref:cell division protein FtsQ/DivIB n=1 Tax=Dysgonomonas sp. 511 TaxID=2302930 RepID=UPI0013CF90FB|nr:hypothetical protein [Dysgonomonas sp. 511]NDV79234.1 hypothetical protein [Dysgonomonas sp. 511]
MKKVLVIIGICLIAGYLIFAAFYFQGKPKGEMCIDFKVEMKGKGIDTTFVMIDDIRKVVDAKGLNPKGKLFSEIDTDAIEAAILENHMIKEANVFITNDGSVKVQVEGRVPVLRIISNKGENYYIDIDGLDMPLSKRGAAYLPVATGAINKEFATRDLYKFALFLHNNEFWNAQIEQIVVLPNKDIKLIPRVGDHEIILGDITGFEERLDKLFTFYQNGLNETGWNKYSVINLKFDKQVVGTKR